MKTAAVVFLSLPAVPVFAEELMLDDFQKFKATEWNS